MAADFPSLSSWPPDSHPCFYAGDPPENTDPSVGLFMNSVYGPVMPPLLDVNDGQANLVPSYTGKRYISPHDLTLKVPPPKKCRTDSENLSYVDVLTRIKKKAEELLTQHADALEKPIESATSLQNILERAEDLFAHITQGLNEQNAKEAGPLVQKLDSLQADLSLPHLPLAVDQEEAISVGINENPSPDSEKRDVDDEHEDHSNPSCVSTFSQSDIESIQKSAQQNDDDDDDDYDPSQSDRLSCASSSSKTSPAIEQASPEKGKTLSLHKYLRREGKSNVTRSALDILINKNNINAYDSNGDTPLHIAVRYKRKATVIKFLIAKGANPKARNLKGETCLHAAVAAAKTEIVKVLLNRGADPSITDANGIKPAEMNIQYPSKSSKENIRRLFQQYKPGVKFPESTEIPLNKLLKVTPLKDSKRH